jgi:hypothetical protein
MMMRAIWESERDQLLDHVIRNPLLVTEVEDYCIRHVDHIVVLVEESAHRLLDKRVPSSRLTVISIARPARARRLNQFVR